MPIVLGAVVCTHSVPVGILIALVALWGCRELANLQERYWISITGSFILLLTPVLDSRVPHFTLHAVNVGLCAIGVIASIRWFKEPILGDLAGLWVAAPMASAFLLHGGNTNKWGFDVHTMLLMAVLPVWAGDSAAILAGKAFGKSLMAPNISPKKTWEGSIANLVAAVGFSWIVGNWVSVPTGPALACGFVGGTLGQVGDLFESWLKRRTGAKDSGNIFPGHGGLLDRLDSLLFTIIGVSLILSSVGLAR